MAVLRRRAHTDRGRQALPDLVIPFYTSLTTDMDGMAARALTFNFRDVKPAKGRNRPVAGSALAAAQVRAACNTRVSCVPGIKGRRFNSRRPSQLEAAGLAHTRAHFVAKWLALRALADGRNVLFEIMMASRPLVESWLAALHRAGYTVAGVFAEITAEEHVSSLSRRSPGSSLAAAERGPQASPSAVPGGHTNHSA
jgi:hypothetical protein